MSQNAPRPLFPVEAPEPAPEADFSTGILPSQAIREAVERGEILATEPIDEDQIQPASLDLRLGAYAYRVPASFLPGRDATVGQKVERFAMHRIELADGAVLERDGVYIVPLMESLRLKRRTSAIANPKSSTGRLDIFARVITDHGFEFDHIREAYRGPLWCEISPRSFSVLVRTGSRLVQLRIKRGSPLTTQSALERLHEQVGLVDVETDDASLKRGKLSFSVNTEPSRDSEVIGYRAKKNAFLIDLDKEDHYDPLDFWEPILARPGRPLILDPNDFYILGSRESVTVPPDHAAEMLAFDTLVGEFRVHYAGFFDPGFGHDAAGGSGAKAVLEVRSRDVPFVLEHGQVVGRLCFERLTARPDKLYGLNIGSNYQRQGLALSKQFRRARP